jgi:hypothetical protein
LPAIATGPLDNAIVQTRLSGSSPRSLVVRSAARGHVAQPGARRPLARARLLHTAARALADAAGRIPAIVLVLVYVGAVMVLFLIRRDMPDINVDSSLRKEFAATFRSAPPSAFLVVVEMALTLLARGRSTALAFRGRIP